MDKYDKEKVYSTKYSNFEWILYEFLDENYLDSNTRNGQKIIKIFCKNRKIGTLKLAIKEGKELLLLNPFPWKWITENCQITINQLNKDISYKKFTELECKNGEDVKEWVRWIINIIEKEVKNMYTKNSIENSKNNHEERGYEK